MLLAEGSLFLANTWSFQRFVCGPPDWRTPLQVQSVRLRPGPSLVTSLFCLVLTWKEWMSFVLEGTSWGAHPPCHPLHPPGLRLLHIVVGWPLLMLTLCEWWGGSWDASILILVVIGGLAAQGVRVWPGAVLALAKSLTGRWLAVVLVVITSLLPSFEEFAAAGCLWKGILVCKVATVV